MYHLKLLKIVIYLVKNTLYSGQQNNVRKCLDVSQKGRKLDLIITRCMIVFIASEPHDTYGGVGGGICNLQTDYQSNRTETIDIIGHCCKFPARLSCISLKQTDRSHMSQRRNERFFALMLTGCWCAYLPICQFSAATCPGFPHSLL